MNLQYGINILIAPLIALILVMLDYARNRSSDVFQRRILLLMVLLTTAALLTELARDAFAGMPGQAGQDALYWVYFANLNIQMAASVLSPVFIDYSMRKNPSRGARYLVVCSGIWLVNFVALIVNGWTGFYYVVTPSNELARGSVANFRHLLSLVPLLLLLLNFVLNRKYISRHLIGTYAMFILPTFLGAVLDASVPGSRLMWPCFAMSLLFAYLFIVNSDSRIDSLTGINNRRSCDEYLVGLTKTARRQPMVFIMLDMDKFKLINDNYGHAQGDVALKDMAGLLKASVRSSDFISRYGGDEFFIVAVNCDNADIVLDRLNHNVAVFNAHNSRPFKIEISVGFDVYTPADARTPAEFLNHVDGLMYQSRAARRVGR